MKVKVSVYDVNHLTGTEGNASVLPATVTTVNLDVNGNGVVVTTIGTTPLVTAQLLVRTGLDTEHLVGNRTATEGLAGLHIFNLVHTLRVQEPRAKSNT